MLGRVGRVARTCGRRYFSQGGPNVGGGSEMPGKFQAPLPIGRNIMVATTLLGFVGGTYAYTVYQIRSVSFL